MLSSIRSKLPLLQQQRIIKKVFRDFMLPQSNAVFNSLIYSKESITFTKLSEINSCTYLEVKAKVFILCSIYLFLIIKILSKLMQELQFKIPSKDLPLLESMQDVKSYLSIIAQRQNEYELASKIVKGDPRSEFFQGVDLPANVRLVRLKKLPKLKLREDIRSMFQPIELS